MEAQLNKIRLRVAGQQDHTCRAERLGLGDDEVTASRRPNGFSVCSCRIWGFRTKVAIKFDKIPFLRNKNLNKHCLYGRLLQPKPSTLVREPFYHKLLALPPYVGASPALAAQGALQDQELRRFSRCLCRHERSPARTRSRHSAPSLREM